MNYFPIFVNLQYKSILVVGGGSVAARKIALLIRTKAIINIVAEKVCLELLSIIKTNNIKLIKSKFHKNHLENVFLVITATNDKTLNRYIFQAASKKCIFVNSVDDEYNCSFIFPSIIDRSPIIIGISTGGTAPVLSRLIRQKIEALLPMKLGLVAKLAKKWRNIIKKCFLKISDRRFFWESLFNGSFINQVLNGNIKLAIKILKQQILQLPQSLGEIILVGAGPGDSGLLTLRGLQVIQQADIVLYDSLVSKEILNLIRRDAKCICVGKRAQDKNISQNDINQMLISFCKLGKKVVRLKGGDSFIFGRGGEELEFLKKHGINFQVVPGITSAIGASAYSGIPLTHRNYSHGVLFITGNNDQKNYDMIDWSTIANCSSTIVIYMFKTYSKDIYNKLILYGCEKKTPIALISEATTFNQKVLIGTLENLPTFASYVQAPTVLIIGKVVNLHKKLKWFKVFNEEY